MSAIEVNASSSICRKCGTAYGRLKGYFLTSYGNLYKGVGYLPYCKDCVDAMYTDYLAACNNPHDAVRQMCRKLDLYWNESVFDAVQKQSSTRSMMTSYITKINGLKLAGKCYDDTLKEEGTLWVWTDDVSEEIPTDTGHASNAESTAEPTLEDTYGEVSKDIVAFWGPGFTPAMYIELEQRKEYWMSRFPEGVTLDIGTEALIRQICNLEIDINRDRAAGKSIDKNVNMLNTLLGSAMLKPAQKKEDSDAVSENTPFGVWIRRWENQRPIPEIDPELRDVDGIVRYISIWFLGHLCKMLGIRNTYCKLYEDEMAKMRVDKPEYDDEDDEAMFNDIFGRNEDTE